MHSSYCIYKLLVGFTYTGVQLIYSYINIKVSDYLPTPNTDPHSYLNNYKIYQNII